MKIEKRIVIEGKPCSEVFKYGDIIVYEVDTDDRDSSLLYFARGDTVLFSQTINADCSQNTGFISELSFNKET